MRAATCRFFGRNLGIRLDGRVTTRAGILRHAEWCLLTEGDWYGYDKSEWFVLSASGGGTGVHQSLRLASVLNGIISQTSQHDYTILLDTPAISDYRIEMRRLHRHPS